MAHLSGIGLENFRVFKENTWFDFAPLTILTGPNSSGKSSILKAIQLIKNNLNKSNKIYETIGELDLTSTNHHLGFFKNCVNKNSKSDHFCITYLGKFTGCENKLLVKLIYQPQDSNIYSSGILTSLEIINPHNKGCVLKYTIVDSVMRIFIDFKFFICHFDNTIIKERNIQTNLQLYYDIYNRNAAYVHKDFPMYNGSYSELIKSYCRKEHPNFDELELVVRNWENFQGSFELINEFKEYNPELPIFDYLFKRTTYVGDKSEFWDSINKVGHDLNEKYTYKDIKKWEIDFLSNMEFEFPLDSNYYKGDDQSNNYLNRFLNALEQIDIWNIFDISCSNVDKDTITKVKSEKSYSSPLLSYIDFIVENRIQLAISSMKGDIKLHYNCWIIQFVTNGLNNILKSIDQFSSLNLLESNRANIQRLYSISSQGTSFNQLLLEFQKLNLTKESNEIEFINFWLAQFEIDGFITIDVNKEGVGSSIYLGDRLLADLGYGITQFLPILLKIAIISQWNLYFDEDQQYRTQGVLYIEEPETNLHPRLQSLLADLFIDAKQKFFLNFIIETHSEYLIRKLQFLTAKGLIKPEETSIYYLHHPERIPKGEQQVKKIEINKDGTLSDDFGSGFFDEADNIAIQLFALNKIQNN